MDIVLTSYIEQSFIYETQMVPSLIHFNIGSVCCQLSEYSYTQVELRKDRQCH